MSAPHPYKFDYELRKNLDTDTTEYRCALSFPLSNKPTYHMVQTFEEGMEEDVMCAMFAQMVIDELTPKLREELPHLFSPDPRGKPIKPTEPFVGMLRGKPIRRDDPDWLDILEDPAFNLNPNVELI